MMMQKQGGEKKKTGEQGQEDEDSDEEMMEEDFGFKDEDERHAAALEQLTTWATDADVDREVAEFGRWLEDNYKTY